MRLASLGDLVFRRSLAAQVIFVLFMVLYYGALLTSFSFNFFEPTTTGLTFNSMLEHLLHLEFFVDPAAVGDEGYLRGGYTYAYWGIFCALIRLPLLAVPGGLDLDVTAMSCLAAVVLAGVAKLRTAMLVRRHCPSSVTCDALFALLVIYIVFGGAQVSYLKPSIFQEVVLWSCALAAAFVYFAIRSLLAGASPASSTMMACFAGLALLTRVSFGIGLYLALGLFLAVLVFDGAAGQRQGILRRSADAAMSSAVMVPLATLAGFALLTAVVNYERWGDPLSFAYYPGYILHRIYPERAAVVAEYGLFNLGRIPYALQYYFLPVWPFQTTDGTFLLSGQRQLFDMVELPPGSLLITDLLGFFLGGVAVVEAVRGRLPPPVPLACLSALAAGLLAPWVLILTAASVSHRYRMEFYPAIDLLMFTGFFVASGKCRQMPLNRHLVRWASIATVISVVSAHAALIMYKPYNTFGMAEPYLRDGVFRFYYEFFARKLHRLISIL